MQRAASSTTSWGEPIVVAAKALEVPTDVLQRMLLFINPRVGQSVERVYELAELYGEISVDAARRLVAIWRDADVAESRPVRHEPVAWRTAAENARRALSRFRAARAAARDPVARPRQRAMRRCGNDPSLTAS
jgi:hypothetical protein